MGPVWPGTGPASLASEGTTGGTWDPSLRCLRLAFGPVGPPPAQAEHQDPPPVLGNLPARQLAWLSGPCSGALGPPLCALLDVPILFSVATLSCLLCPTKPQFWASLVGRPHRKDPHQEEFLGDLTVGDAGQA